MDQFWPKQHFCLKPIYLCITFRYQSWNCSVFLKASQPEKLHHRHAPPSCVLFFAAICVFMGGRGHNRQESLLPSLERILWLKAQIVSDFLSDTSKCRLYRKTFTSNTKRLECSHIKATIQTQKVQHRQPPHPREGFKPFTLRQRWAWGKETSVHEASKQQMVSTGNLPLEKLHCCLHIF